MDPTTILYPHAHCPARGQTGQGNIGIHSRTEQRFILCGQKIQMSLFPRL